MKANYEMPIALLVFVKGIGLSPFPNWSERFVMCYKCYLRKLMNEQWPGYEDFFTAYNTHRTVMQSHERIQVRSPPGNILRRELDHLYLFVFWSVNEKDSDSDLAAESPQCAMNAVSNA